MNTNRRPIRSTCELILLLVALPLLGLLGVDRPVPEYLEFPPVTRYIRHAGFSWPVFVLLAAGLLAAVGPFVWRCLTSQRALPAPTVQPVTRFPWWGWLGLLLGAASWILAWNRFAWFAPFQDLTFTPLWLAYILTINALSIRRTGHCLLRERPLLMAGLFLLSAGFWWYFEFLNRFVQNWFYVGASGWSAWRYFWLATLPFATVLPAVMSTHELLASFPRLSAGLDYFMPVRVRDPHRLAGLTALICGGALAGLALWPNYLFPFLWLGPMGLVLSMQVLHGESTLLAPLARGDWRKVWLLALAALVCGFFWEMWNYYSAAKWIYAVPFVNRFHIFEMPLLGYAGYLPFGLECALVAGWLNRERIAEPETVNTPTRPPPAWARVACGVNALILAALAVYVFLMPGIQVVRMISSPELRGPEIPRAAWRLHRHLTPLYERWARERVASGRAGHLALQDVPSTEWPMFGSVYYLWATELLQTAWEQDHSRSAEAPAAYARGAIEASVALVMDPIHHTWVKTHWGASYLHRENVFFRSLIIAALTSYERLSGNQRHRETLRDQADTLAAELDASPFGILNDYPGECYPIDVFAAVAIIARADRLLGTDHRAFIERERRAFQGAMLDPCGLPPYLADPGTGEQLGPSRGIGNSYVLIFAPELYPDWAGLWYERYERHFWQDRGWAKGFREFSRRYPAYEWNYDVDAGPIIAGFSPAANAFGMAAAKVNGRLDHAYELTTQALIASWPLPDGTWLGSRLLSDPVHAPYLGEACLLFLLAQRPAKGVPIKTGGSLPGFVWVGVAIYFGGAILLLLGAIRRIRALYRPAIYPMAPVQAVAWPAALAVAVMAALAGSVWIAVCGLLLALWLPHDTP